MGNRPYGKVVFAGTFDRLHEGHKHVLRTAFKMGDTVSIGLTTDEMISHKTDRELIQPFDTRRSALLEFLRSEGVEQRGEVFPISTVVGGADKMNDLEALIVSDEIKVVENAFEINEMRIENGLERFHIVVVPRVRTEDGRPISSSRIRKGDKFEGKLVY